MDFIEEINKLIDDHNRLKKENDLLKKELSERYISKVFESGSEEHRYSEYKRGIKDAAERIKIEYNVSRFDINQIDGSYRTVYSADQSSAASCYQLLMEMLYER